MVVPDYVNKKIRKHCVVAKKDVKDSSSH